MAVTLRGRWDVPTVMASEPALYSLVEDPSLEAARHSVVDISGVTRLDTVGAIAVSVLRDQLAKYGTAEISGARTAQAALLDQVAKVDAQPLPKLPKLTTIDRIAADWANGRSAPGFEARSWSASSASYASSSMAWRFTPGAYG